MSSRPPSGSIRGRGPGSNVDVVLVLAIAWLVSALRVAGTVASGRAFGVESTLALLALVAIPVATWPRRHIARD